VTRGIGERRWGIGGRGGGDWIGARGGSRWSMSRDFGFESGGLRDMVARRRACVIFGSR
jgi:hypothetical protein